MIEFLKSLFGYGDDDITQRDDRTLKRGKVTVSVNEIASYYGKQYAERYQN